MHSIIYLYAFWYIDGECFVDLIFQQIWYTILQDVIVEKEMPSCTIMARRRWILFISEPLLSIAKKDQHLISSVLVFYCCYKKISSEGLVTNKNKHSLCISRSRKQR